jgi:CPA1 family monovalent cation:H+ antiporter
LTALSQFDAFFNILILVTVITLITWRLRFPPTIAFIIAGVLSSFAIRLELPSISPETFVLILLPPILFQEALHLEINGLIEEADSVFTFAFLGTLIMQTSVALFAWMFLDFEVLEALLFGILIAPTDPVAVIRVFHSVGVQKKFQIIVTGESLFNDGIAIVIYSILVSIITIGSITLFDISTIVLVTIFGGVIIGFLSGYLVHTIFCWTDDKFAEVLVSFIAAFGVFRIAEELHASGVLAVVIAGLIINYRTRNYGGFSDESFEMMEALWEFIGFLTSSIAFIFIGMNLDRNVFISNFSLSLVLLFIILAFRFLMVEVTSLFLEKTRKKNFPRNWREGLSWSGLRGAISIVLVLGIAGMVPNSNIMIAMTFGIVILSNVLQGISMGWVIQSQKLSLNLPELVHSDSGTLELSENYNSEGYDLSKGSFEKYFFSAPEYFINETRFGSWISNKIISVLRVIDRYLISKMSVTSKGIIVNALKFIINALSNLLSIINQYISRKEIQKRET